MDRDQRWERIKKAYDLLVNGKGTSVSDFAKAIKQEYQGGTTDEFMVPLINGNLTLESSTIQEEDAVIFFNFRTDRPRQLTEVLTQKDYHEYDMHTLPLHFVTFTNYDQTFKDIGVIFEKENLTHTLGETISAAGRIQLRIAETEKYPHVTFFFNGGAEQPFTGEDRILVPSPKVATYDEQPEMSAPEITDKLIAYVSAKLPDFICLNYANADMVGHTGDFKAAQKAVETVDGCLGRLLDNLVPLGYVALIVADHGNADVMVNPDGSPNTAHSTHPVPVILAGSSIDKGRTHLSSGKLGDLAPTILHLMGIPKPVEMTGNCLISEN
jgi:2,3-bisphosphoglycerate-independent phosphoglycerate mutase